VSYVLVQGQQSMTLDSRRNDAYAQALAKAIAPESVVLDLGAGLGIHGLLAAKLGAKRVYLVEPEDIISVAAQIAKANGYSDRVHCLQGKIEEVNLPEQVDVIISVFTGNFLLEEDLLPSLFYARDKYLKPEGVMIPQAAVMEVVPVRATELYQQEIESWSVPHMDIDHTPARMYASQSIYYYSKDLDKAHYLAEPAKLLTLDFHQANSTYCQTEAKFAIAESGICHGFAGWFKMQLGETWLSTAPHEPPLHWSAAFLPLDPPIELTAGEEVTFKLQRPPGGDWTWEVKTARTQQVRSTFFSIPRSLKSLKKVAWDYQPQINDKGKAALYVLEHSNGTFSVEKLSYNLAQTFPHLFNDPQTAINFVQNLVGRFS
jgi:predicted RNA methylase